MSKASLSLAGWFTARATRNPRRRALTFEDTTFTYGELVDRVDRLAGGLRAAGVQQGDRVGYVGTNHPALLETFLACARLGAVFVPLNFRLTGPELAYVIGHAGIHTLLADPGRQEVIDPVRSDLPVQRYVAVEGAPDARWSDYDQLLACAPVQAGPPVGDDELAVIMFTSGTTGKPKGVMLTHGNLWWNVTNLMHLYDTLADDVTLVSSPLFHIAGLNVTIFSTWRRGGEVVLHRTFEPAALLRDIERYGVSTLFGAPTMFQVVSDLPEFTTADLSTVRLIICGGAPVPESLIRLYLERGVRMLNGYGLTETAPSAAFLTPDHVLDKPASVGQPPLYSELTVVDDEGGPAPVKTSGEICVRGPNVTPGYWNDPDATAAAFDGDGWFHTGDLGYLDEDGFLYVVDRLKDVIVSGGENVASAEVENVLLAHAGIADVAVIGTPHERWGETVTAVVVPRGELPALEDVRQFAGERLARYKLPTRLVQVDQLPRNPSGKILKEELRHRFAGR